MHDKPYAELCEVPENEFIKFPLQPHMENVIAIMHLTEFWSSLLLSASTPFCKPGSCKLILAPLSLIFPPFH